jgi:hypothetical protein
MTPTDSDGAGSSTTAVGSITIATKDFDTAADEFAQFMIGMPKSWDEGTLTAQFLWTSTGGGAAETVEWNLRAVALSDDNPIASASFGSDVTVSDTRTADDDLEISAVSAALTAGGTPAESDLVVFEVWRDVSGDDLAVDAKLIGVRLLYTVDAANDA